MRQTSKDHKARRVDANKARQADFNRAIKQRIRTKPAYIYTGSCSDPGMWEPVKAVVEARRRYLYGG